MGDLVDGGPLDGELQGVADREGRHAGHAEADLVGGGGQRAKADQRIGTWFGRKAVAHPDGVDEPGLVGLAPEGEELAQVTASDE